MPTTKAQIEHVKIKSKKFATALIKHNGNRTEAMLELNPTAKRATAASEGYRWAKKKSVQQEVEKALERANVSPAWWVEKHKEIAVSLDEQKLKRASVADVQKSLEALGKLMGLTSSGVVTRSNNLFLDLSGASVTEVLSRRREYKEWFDEVLEGESLEVSPPKLKP